ncbi:MAG: TetR/AcrR family transcriptional regulator [Actinomycetota bacterium]
MASKAMAQTLREKVIKAAVKYVADNGPDGLSFRQIAADAGVSHQAPYHHFGDRSAILGEIALEGFRKFADVMGAPARAGEDSENCVRLCERYVDFAIANKGHFRVMFRADLCQMHESPETQKAADDAFATLLDAVSEMVGDSASIDEIRVQATAMWSLAHGLATLIIDGPLETKIGKVSDRRALVRSVAQLAAKGFRGA